MMLATSIQQKPYSVSDINNLAKNYLESTFNQISVIGEVSKITNHSSGHWYFTIKDDNSSIDCAMFLNANRGKQLPLVGNKIVIIGKLTIYSTSGRYQIICENLLIADELGNQQAKLKALYEKLKKEGLFDNKKPLPKNIKKVAIITACNSAAANDILRVYENNKSYLIKLSFYDSLVQGENAAKDIINNIKKANETDADLILIARGGGSKEDLFCFNDELLVRQIVASNIPIITGIGHEIDTHLSDLASSKYFATPTAAMQWICYNLADRLMDLDNYQNTLNMLAKAKIERKNQHFLYYLSKFSKKDAIIKFSSFNENLNMKTKLIKQKLEKKLINKSYMLKNKNIYLNTKINNILYKNLENIRLYEKTLNKTNAISCIQNMQYNLLNSKNIINKAISDNLNQKIHEINSFKNHHKTVFFKVKSAKFTLNEQEKIINYEIKSKIKEKLNKIRSFECILNTNKAFLESVKEYARIKKNGKGEILSNLKVGDEITLSTLECEKTAKIIK